MDKITTIKQSAKSILTGNIESAKNLINKEYPFKKLKPEGRSYTDKEKYEQFVRDGFIDRYTGEKASFRTWLTAVARYQVLSHIRDIRYHDYVSLDDVEPVGDSDVKSRLFDEEEMLEFQKLLEILSKEDRQIFTALFWYEKSYEEVGQEMNMPVDRVYSRVSRGKKKLKKNNRWLGGAYEEYL